MGPQHQVETPVVCLGDGHVDAATEPVQVASSGRCFPNAPGPEVLPQLQLLILLSWELRALSLHLLLDLFTELQEEGAGARGLLEEVLTGLLQLVVSHAVPVWAKG
eukprot:5524632-Lingulodinium_polyedra.AAC.1